MKGYERGLFDTAIHAENENAPGFEKNANKVSGRHSQKRGGLMWVIYPAYRFESMFGTDRQFSQYIDTFVQSVIASEGRIWLTLKHQHIDLGTVEHGRSPCASGITIENCEKHCNRNRARQEPWGHTLFIS